MLLVNAIFVIMQILCQPNAERELAYAMAQPRLMLCGGNSFMTVYKKLMIIGSNYVC